MVKVIVLVFENILGKESCFVRNGDYHLAVALICWHYRGEKGSDDEAE